MMGQLIKGFGQDHVIWGTDSVWYGSPQWQIEAMRKVEIPEDLQEKHGWAPLVCCVVLGFGLLDKIVPSGSGLVAACI